MGSWLILLIDNAASYLIPTAENLRLKNYEVQTAKNELEADAILSQMWVHLVIADIRTKNERDSQDLSGLNLARRYCHLVPFIINSRFPQKHFKDISQALDQLDGEPVAVAFADKNDGNEALFATIQTFFQEGKKENFGLKIRLLDSANSPLFQILHSLAVPGDWQNQVIELESLLRRLFREFEFVTLGRLVWQTPGRCGLTALAGKEVGESPRTFCLTITRQPPATHSPQNAPRLNLIHTNARARQVTTAETTHFTGRLFELMTDEPALEDLDSLANRFGYGELKTLTEEICTLLEEDLPAYRVSVPSPNRFRVGEDFGALLGLDLKRWDEAQFQARLAAMQAYLPNAGCALTLPGTGYHLSLPSQEIDCPGFQPLFQAWLKKEATLLRAECPGQITKYNLLTTRQGGLWLTDFHRPVRAPIFWPQVMLEAMLRFDLYTGHKLERVYQLESTLAQAPYAGEPAPVVDEDPLTSEEYFLYNVKIQNTIFELRRRCDRKRRQAQENELAYQFALFLQALKRLLDSPLDPLTPDERARQAHLLIALALLAGRLVPAAPAPRPAAELALEDPVAARLVMTDGGVEIDGRLLVLTPKMWKFLWRLRQTPGKPVSYKELDRVTHDSSVASDDPDNAMQVLKGRLADKMNEFAPGSGDWITPVPSYGYCLTLKLKDP